VSERLILISEMRVAQPYPMDEITPLIYSTKICAQTFQHCFYSKESYVTIRIFSFALKFELYLFYSGFYECPKAFDERKSVFKQDSTETHSQFSPLDQLVRFQT
jgi:hypothetical protein